MRSALARRSRSALIALDTFFDNFDRANASTLGGAYSDQSNTSIVSNKANFPASVSGYAVVRMNSLTKFARCQVYGATSGGTGTGLYIDWLDSNNYARLTKTGPSQYQRITGNSVVFQRNMPADFVDGDVMELQLVGSTVNVYRNGYLFDSFTDSGTINGSPKYGFFAGNSVFGNVDIDNFAVDNTRYAATGFTDDFNRADASTLGSSWTIHSGTFGISSNKAVPLTQGSLEGYWGMATVLDPAPVQDVTVDLASSGTVNVGIAFGVVDANNYYYWHQQLGIGGGYFRKVVGGNRVIDTGVGGAGSGTFRVVFNKATGDISLYNGGLQYSTTDGSPLSGGRVGIMSQFLSNNPTYDNFIVAP